MDQNGYLTLSAESNLTRDKERGTALNLQLTPLSYNQVSSIPLKARRFTGKRSILNRLFGSCAPSTSRCELFTPYSLEKAL